MGRIVVEDPGNPANIRFLHVLQAADKNGLMDSASLVQSVSGNAFDGAVFGTSLVLFASDITTAFTGTLYIAPASATTHYVTGLAANGNYTVAEQVDSSGNLQITITPGGSYVADAAGVLAFNP